MRKVSFPAGFGMTSEPAKGRRRTSASVEPLEGRRLFSTAYAVFETSDGNNLVEFDTATPGTFTRTVPVTGLPQYEFLRGLDFRPATGELYAMSQRGVFVIDPATGAATQAGFDYTPFDGRLVPLSGYGFDFDAGRDVARVTSRDDRNLRYDPVRSQYGSGVTDDANLDEPGADEAVADIAYDNNRSFAGGPRTLYGLDSLGDALVRIGGPGGSPSPDGGVVTTIGPLGVRFTADLACGFDIAQDGTAYAAVIDVDTGNAGLFTVNLATGAATKVGNIGNGGGNPRAFAVAPDNRAPTANPDAYDVQAGQVLTVPAPGVLGNDTDPEGDALTAVLTAAPRGDLTLNPDGSFTYDPGDMTGGDSFRYAVTDGTSRSFETEVKLRQPGSLPTITLDDARVFEGDSGSKFIEFPFHLSHPNNADEVRFTVTPTDGTATGAGAGRDYLRGPITVVVPAGFPYTDLFVSFTVFGDTAVEPDEQFTIDITDVQNATVADGHAVGTIVDDDGAPPPPPEFSISDVTQNEGDSGPSTFLFTISRSHDAGHSSVNFTTAFGQGTSVQDMDPQQGTVSFAPGETSKQIGIVVKGDRNVETDNVFYVNLSDATNATIADGQGVGTILNDDAPPPPPPTSTLNINDVTKDEGDGGKTAFTFTVTRSSGTGTASVRYATAYGFNASKEDFAAQSGTVSFAAGQTSRTVTIYVNGDTKQETDNTFFVNLTNPVNAVIGDGQGLGTIRNDD